MIPISAKERIFYTPEHYEGAEDAPVYELAVPTVAGKALWHREINTLGARSRSQAEMIELVRQGVRDLYPAEGQGGALETVAAYEAAGDAPDEALGDRFVAIEEIVARDYEPYRTAIADRGYFLEMLPLIAADLFLVGVTGRDDGIVLENGRPTAESLNKLPHRDLIAVGYKAVAMMSPDAETKKN